MILSAQDDLSGVDKIFYRINDGSWQPAPLPPNNKFLVSREGKIDLSYYATDLAGNASAVESADFWGDNTPPVISSFSLKHYTNTNTISTPSAVFDEQGSGVKKAAVRVGPSCETETPEENEFFNIEAGPASLPGLADGYNLVCVWVKDGVGNRSGVASDWVIVDKILPVVSITPGLDGTCTNQPSFSISGTGTRGRWLLDAMRLL